MPGAVDAAMERLNTSIDVDAELFREDIRGSVAHAHGLARAGIITHEEAETIVEGLEKIRLEIEGGELVWKRELEDVHMNVETRLKELGSRPSLLNPLWYAGSFGIGALAAVLGDRASLGFVAETERQVEGHLKGHLERLPEGDQRSRAIVEAMRHDEVGHGEQAMSAGGARLPAPVRELMRRTARVMTHTAYRI